MTLLDRKTFDIRYLAKALSTSHAAQSVDEDVGCTPVFTCRR